MATQANTATKRPEAPGVLWHGRYSLEEREAMIREAAYYRYLQRGCEPGHELEDWLAAETAFGFGRPAAFPAETPNVEVQQRSVHGPREDDALKHLIKQHPRQAIPRVESVEPENSPLKQ